MTSERDLGGLNASRETVERLIALSALITRWNPAINLVSPRSLSTLWHRHILDSAQLWGLRPPAPKRWYDLGAGGGFPGLVIASLAAEFEPSLRVHLIESDQRKCAFLATAARTLGLEVQVHSHRILDVALPPGDVVSARALAPLSLLLHFVKVLRRSDGIALFPKGKTVHKELREAEQRWTFVHRLHPSLTEPGAAVVEIGALDGPN